MDVEPTLASVAFETLKKVDATKSAAKLQTTCSAIDDALCGGFDFGRVSCISGDGDDAKSAVSLAVRC
jgi:hypothetical protein